MSVESLVVDLELSPASLAEPDCCGRGAHWSFTHTALECVAAIAVELGCAHGLQDVWILPPLLQVAGTPRALRVRRDQTLIRVLAPNGDGWHTLLIATVAPARSTSDECIDDGTAIGEAVLGQPDAGYVVCGASTWHTLLHWLCPEREINPTPPWRIEAVSWQGDAADPARRLGARRRADQAVDIRAYGAAGAMRASLHGLRLGNVDAEPIQNISLVALVMILAREALPQFDASADTDLAAEGASSLDLIRWLQRIEDALGVSLRTQRKELFERPIGREVAAVVARELSSSAEPLPGPTSAPRTLELSGAQRRLWMAQQLSHQRAAFNVCIRLACHGGFDATRLQRNWQALLDANWRLSALVSGPASQLRWVPGAAQPRVTCYDLTGLSESEREARTGALIRAGEEAAFDLETEAPCRLQLIRRSSSHTVLALVFHHIVVDALSMPVVIQTLLFGAEPAPARGTYDDFLALAAASVNSPRRAENLAYWQSALRELSPFKVPTTLAPRSGWTGPSHLDVPLTDAVARSVFTLSRELRVTPFVVLAAALGETLRRTFGVAQVAFATLAAGRPSSRFDDVIGFFSNPVTLRFATTGAESFAALAQRVRSEVANALDHAEVPFEEVVAAHPNVDRGAPNPWSEIMVLAQSAVTREFSGDGWRVCWEHERLDCAPVSTTMHPLQLVLMPDSDRLRVQLAFDAQRFHPHEVAELGKRLADLLGAVCEHKEFALHDLTTALEREQNAHRMFMPQPESETSSIVARVTEQLGAVGSQPLLFTGHGDVSADALLARVRALAEVLDEAGCRDGQRVLVMVPYGPDLIAALISVLATGGIYVPVDPSAPPARVSQIASDARARVVLATRSTLEQASRLGARVVRTDEIAQVDGRQLGAWPPAKPGDPAYLMYTSGSSGQPKGVVVEHAQLAAFLKAMDSVVQAHSSAPTWLAMSSPGFDISLLELLWPLTRGWRVALMDARDALRDPDALELLAERAGVTHLQATPTWLRSILMHPAGARLLERLSELLVGGEELPAWLARELARRVGVVRNMYGPTEATIWTSSWNVAAAPEVVSLGTPLRGAWFRLLDEATGGPTASAIGELMLCGATVARGYWNRDDLTAARFRLEPGAARGYRSGDRVRWWSSGELQWLGRTDGQVKVGAVRMELGEVEASLRTVAGVEDVAVLYSAEDRRLDALLVPRRDSAEASETLAVRAREALRQSVPEQALPRVIAIVPEIPRTPSGKLDTRAARRLAEAVAPSVAEATESPVLALFRTTLRNPDLGPDDDFFSAGGDSLAAIQVASDAQREGLAVTPQDVIARRTAAGVEQALSARRLIGEGFTLSGLRERSLGAFTLGSRTSSQDVLVTGATGMVGSHLLGALTRSGARCVCVVRSGSAGHGLERLRQASARFGVVDVDWSRVEVVAADLASLVGGRTEDAALPAFGAVFHCAAEVDFAKSLEALEEVNVQATASLLRAAAAHAADFHFVSTVSVADAVRPDAVPDETTPLDQPARLLGGYAQSKWLAERLVAQAEAAGLRTWIYRVGPIAASRTGEVALTDAFVRAIIGSVAVGRRLAMESVTIPHLLLADDAASAIVTLSARSPATWHVVGGDDLPVTTLFDWLEQAGHRLVPSSYTQWRRAIRDAGPSNPAFALLAVLSEQQDGIVRALPRVSEARSHLALQEAGAVVPRFGQQDLLRLLERLSALGHLPRPSATMGWVPQ